MKNNGKFSVCYNNQVIVDVKSHIVANYNVDNNPADVGTINKVTNGLKEITNSDIVINILDKGYNDRNDMRECLENGIIPEVTLPKDKKEYEIEFLYEEREITEEIRRSTNKEDIKKCLRSGIIPQCYEEYLSNPEIKEVVKVETIKEAETLEDKMTIEEKRDLALKNKCFVKDKVSDKVFCPEGEILRKKSKNVNGYKYCNKEACRNCKNPCTISKYKELIMSKNQFISTSKKELKEKYEKRGKRKWKREKVVIMKLKPKKEEIDLRMATSEHVHGTMKRADNMSYFLLKSKEKTNGEMALYYCATNLRRMINLKGVEHLKEYLQRKIEEKKYLIKNETYNIIELR